VERSATANAINPSGQGGSWGFAQTADGSAHAFFYTNATMYDLGTLEVLPARPTASTPESVPEPPI